MTAPASEVQSAQARADLVVQHNEQEAKAKTIGTLWAVDEFPSIERYLPKGRRVGCGYSLEHSTFVWPTRIWGGDWSVCTNPRFSALQEKLDFNWPAETSASDRYREIVMSAAINKLNELMGNTLEGVQGLAYKIQRIGGFYSLGAARGIQVNVVSGPLGKWLVKVY